MPFCLCFIIHTCPVITTRLEMALTFPALPGATPPHQVTGKGACAALNRFLYATVGANWHWSGRLDWNDDDWLGILIGPN